uniref:Sorbitol dehydrogenase n=1 Tax=Syphacia muris TaxID=451379 RepID=A0A0N5APX8_9BILA
MEKNLCCVLNKVNELGFEERPIPKPKSNQLLIRIHTVGICGSDVHFWQNGRIGHFVVKKPLILGHECCGRVVGIGENVKGFKIGDRVALEVGLGCRECEFCKKGKYNLCVKSTFFGTPPTDGALCRYVAHDADFCFKLPDHVSWEQGSFLEPLSVAVYACRRAGVTFGQKLLILGAGPIGLITLLTAKAAGVSKIAIVDILDHRLEMAKQLGADYTLNAKNMKPVDAAAKIKDLLGCEPEISLECSGASACIETGLLATKPGGLLMLVGLGNTRDEIPIIEAAIREVDVRGILRYENCYPTALELVSSGAVNLDKLTTTHYKLEKAEEAFQRFLKGDVIKVFIDVDEN